MSLTCDITGNNRLFRISGLRYRVDTPAEAYKLVLPQVGYKESVVVKKVNADGMLVTLSNGVDFVFTGGNRDTASEALVKAAYPTFSNQLYNSFIIPLATFGDAQYIDIVVEYQSVFPNILTSAADQAGNPNGPECSPELLRQILTDLILLKGAATGEDVNYSTAQSLPSPLATDYTGVLADNFISDEAHNILANDGKVVVRPANGSFYDHELVVRDANGNALVREQDYTVRGMDIAATKVCEHASGVWRFIIITKNITGMVYISYHAFGGEVNVQNFLNLRDQVQNLKDYIDKGSFLTSSSIGGTPLMQEIIERLNTLDRYYMSLNMSGYKDMSNRYVASPVSANDPNSNWYRVAYLYKQVNSSDDNNYFHTYTKDSVRLKIRLENSGIILDMFVYANVMNGTLKLTIMEADSDTGSASPSDYSNLRSVVLPQFRLVWRKDGDYQYGAVLQVKFPIPTGHTTETVSIENHNKAGLGGWILRGDVNGTDNVVAENDTVMLPDGEHTWLASGNASTYGSVVTYPDFSRGTMLWAGSHPFIKEGDNDGSTLIPINNTPINCKAVKRFTFVFFDRVFGQYIKKHVVANSINEKNCQVYGMFDELDYSSFIFKITHDINNVPIFIIYMRPGTKSNMLHRFDLRQIYINSTEG